MSRPMHPDEVNELLSWEPTFDEECQQILDGAAQARAVARAQATVRPTTGFWAACLGMGLLLGLLACTGPAGPTGPEGRAGEQAATRSLTLNAVVDSTGYAYAELPTDVGVDRTKPPVLGCYYSTSPNYSTWTVIAQSDKPLGPRCRLFFSQRWLAEVLYLPPGAAVAFTVIY